MHSKPNVHVVIIYQSSSRRKIDVVRRRLRDKRIGFLLHVLHIVSGNEIVATVSTEVCDEILTVFEDGLLDTLLPLHDVGDYFEEGGQVSFGFSLGDPEFHGDRIRLSTI